MIAASTSYDGYAVLFKFGSLVRLRPVAIVRQKAAAKGGLKKGVQTLDVMPIACKLEHKGDAPIRSEHHVLTETDKPALERGAVPFLRHAVKADLLSFPHRTADIHRMRVYDEKGGASSSSSPAISAKAPARRSRSGVRSVLRSTQFCRDSLLGKKSHMTWLFSNHS